MTDARRKNSTAETSESARVSRYESPKAPTGRLLSLREAEEKFGVDEYWVYRWVADGQLHAVLDGKRFRYPEWELEGLTKPYCVLAA
jgi:predicted DNA-binding transcriptional regulator AlpA